MDVEAVYKEAAKVLGRDEVAALCVPLQVVLGGASNLFDTSRRARWFAGAGRHADVVRYEGADAARPAP